MYTRNVKKTHKENTEKRPKNSKAQTKENLDNLGGGQVYNFIVLQKFSSTDKFKLKNIDQILDICLQEYTETVETEIQNEELKCTDCVAEFEGI